MGILCLEKNVYMARRKIDISRLCILTLANSIYRMLFLGFICEFLQNVMTIVDKARHHFHGALYVCLFCFSQYTYVHTAVSESLSAETWLRNLTEYSFSDAGPATKNQIYRTRIVFPKLAVSSL